jgi:hypothetical protein
MSKMAGKDAERVFAANGTLTILAIVVGAAIVNLEHLNPYASLFLLLLVAILMAGVLQLHGILPVNVIRPGLEGIASVVRAFWNPFPMSQELVNEDEILDLTPYRVVERVGNSTVSPMKKS